MLQQAGRPSQRRWHLSLGLSRAKITSNREPSGPGLWWCQWPGVRQASSWLSMAEGRWSARCLLPIRAPSTQGAPSPAWTSATASSSSSLLQLATPASLSCILQLEGSSDHTTALLHHFPGSPLLSARCPSPRGHASPLWPCLLARLPCVLCFAVTGLLWLQVLCAFLATGPLLIQFPLPGALIPTSSPNTYSSLTSLC